MKGVERTELVWKGKYDENGELRKVDRTILPFQVVESVNESKADREKAQRELFTHSARDDKKQGRFRNGWQSFRTRKQPKLQTSASHTYEEPGWYKILVKVVDIFGNDTTKLWEVTV